MDPSTHPRAHSAHREETGLFTACLSLVEPCQPEQTPRGQLLPAGTEVVRTG